MENKIRELEREAATGDPDAAKRLNAANNRAYGVRTIFHFALGKVAAVWCSNFCEVGLIEDIYIDEVGRGIACMRDVRRLADENSNGPTWLGGIVKYLEVPSTVVSCISLAEDRDGWS